MKKVRFLVTDMYILKRQSTIYTTIFKFNILNFYIPPSLIVLPRVIHSKLWCSKIDQLILPVIGHTKMQF